MVRLLLSASLTILLLLPASAQKPTPAAAPASPSPSPTATPSPAPVSLLDGLTAADLDKAIAAIRHQYLNPTALSETEIQRATLAGLLDRLGSGAMLLPARAAAAPSPAPFYREIVGGHIGYLRPGELSQSQLQELDTTLRSFPGKKVDAVILDLRACRETNDFAVVATFADRFLPKGKKLFSLRGPNAQTPRAFVAEQGQLYQGLLALLIDQETAGAAEVLAAVLRTGHGAILIGQTTAGRAVAYEDIALPSGKILRVAVAEAILPEDQPRFPDGVPPDLPVTLPIATKREIFQASLTKGMEPYIFESDRPHLNEAALLAGTNPEIDAAQQRRARGGEKAIPHDTVLQRGVDLVTSIEVYQKQTGRSP